MAELQEKVLHQFPFPVAIRYRRMLDTRTFEEKAQYAISVYEAGLRSLTLGLLGQYLQRDLSVVGNATLNDLAWTLVERPASLNDWTEVFFETLGVYGGQRNRFFIPELYDFYWDTNVTPNRRREDVHNTFLRMAKFGNRVKNAPPENTSDWEKLYHEIEIILNEILLRLEFMAEYDLLYILRQDQGKRGYLYDIYKGQHVTRSVVPLETSQSLDLGWCYLKKSSRDEFLEVHPLIIFWEDDGGDKEQLSEVVVYDSYEKQKSILRYLHTAREKVETREAKLVSLFDHLYYAKLQALRPRRITSKLTWSDLKYLSNQLIKQPQMKSTLSKYDPDLYLQRDDIWHTYIEFLQSEKPGFILIGPSGIGKSNFVFSVASESHKTDSAVCALVHNGLDRRLDFSEVDRHSYSNDQTYQDVLAERFEEVFIQDFNTYLQMKDQDSLSGAKVLELLDDFMKQHGGQLVIIVDAINENRQSSLLLKAINRFVERNIYPWLKLVITSRPESWNDLRKGIKLSEFKYFKRSKEKGQDSNTSELSATVPVVLVTPFTHGELPLVYEKYRINYELKTLYEQLTPTSRILLSDPLALRLVSEITQKKYGGYIPSDILVEELPEKYIAMRLETQRLEERDLEFLEQELLPRLFKAPLYPNQLLYTDLVGEKTARGRSLYDLVFNYDEYDLANASRRVNQSFLNLADSLILVKSEQAVQFQYERFYEYFGGIYLNRSAASSPDPIQFYHDIGGMLEQKPYLWGAVKNAFKRELRRELKNETEYQFIAGVINTAVFARRLFRKAILDGLEEFSKINEDSNALIKWLVNRLVEPCHGPARSIGETTRRLFYRSKFDAEEIEPKQSVAIETAGRLGFKDVLLNAAADRYGAVRRASTLQIFRLWQKDRQAAYQVVDAISQFAVARLGLPDLGVIESLISLSIAMLVHAHKDEDVQHHILQIGRQIIRDILVLEQQTGSTSAGRVRRTLARVLRKPILSVATSWGLSVLEYWGKKDLPAGIKAVEHLFTLTKVEKELAYPLIPYFDANRPGLVDYIDQIMMVENVGDFLLGWVVQAPQIVRVEMNFEDALETLQELTNHSLLQDPPRPMIETYLWSALQLAIRQKNPDARLFAIGERCFEKIHENPRRWWQSHKEVYPVPFLPLTAGVGNYVMLLYTFGQPVKSEIVRKYLKKAIENNDTEFLFTLANYELNYVFDAGYLHPALEVLELIASYRDQEGKVQQAVADLLVRMYFYFPDEVENVLLQGKFSEDISKLVRATAPSDRLNDLMGLRAIGILYDLFLLGPSILREEMAYLTRQGLQLPDLKSLVALLIKEMLNLLAGQAIFPVPTDSPSSRILST